SPIASGGVGENRFDPAWSTADHDPRPAGPDQSVVQMFKKDSKHTSSGCSLIQINGSPLSGHASKANARRGAADCGQYRQATEASNGPSGCIMKRATFRVSQHLCCINPSARPCFYC